MFRAKKVQKLTGLIIILYIFYLIGGCPHRFCRERLILLSYYDNNILKAEEKVDERGNRCNQYYIGTRNGFLVEVFYTEQISLLEALTIDRVGILGKGHSYALGNIMVNKPDLLISFIFRNPAL